MDLKQYTFHIISLVLGSAAFGSVITLIANKGKTKAETKKIDVEADQLLGQVYGRLVEDLNRQLDDMRKQILQQGEQILAQQKREMEYMKVISDNFAEKKQLIAKHERVERELLSKIAALEEKLSQRIKTISAAYSLMNATVLCFILLRIGF